MSIQKEIIFDYSARYFLNGNINNPKKILFVLHGYGQLAEYFIKKFSVISDNSEFLVVAPEGLSRFYLEGFSGRVGATWMTKEDRQNDIKNYLFYLNQVYLQVTSNFSLKDVEISILGFSQGAATATRWVLDNTVRFNNLLLWAGVFPDDMDIEIGNTILSDKSVKLILGNKDPFFNSERKGRLDELLNALSFKPEKIWFDGGHDIDRDTLIKLF